MQTVIQGKNVDITNAIHDYAHQKINKAVHHFEGLLTKIDITLSVHNSARKQDQQTAEVTLFAKGTVIRAVKKHSDLYTAIDLVTDKITRQLKKYKEKQQQRIPVSTVQDDGLEPSINPTTIINEQSPTLPPMVVRNKFFAMPPMSIQAALEQLELIDHDFYMFHNLSTGEINVLYERNHGGYGLIQPHQTSEQTTVSHHKRYIASH
ncbi:ribosome-associated translation inhibitor RaiA [Leptolyngbyaceae cyanobacterium CCMR0082]|uniref:Ribosome hibernation promoting factor n=2 Tax=Adonisia turfae TaxID=2950184 RepID=A0A6M0S0A2_9CYAN|nr:ribosome-associated translation inhibitor RaiA [Adonisia turfae]MDV3347182.1 ribosome-associated translation inhibitor RaiA [Leptothoe sp. LEGE 181152]NEZ59057.1 ribosome-associated translation inhibitor RaiA [Adonisia turfae CCMR0081]NEZ61371.1 ribosome-associated translation inhibitor RaiA [Adonisia turfae CCMR0082]